jgi:probable phosphoglycerate mutase
MPVLLLIRHATNDFVKTGRLPGRTPNIHLNDEGRQQAEVLGELLSKQPVNAVYSSQLERAIETAWRVAWPHNVAIAIRPALADIDNGDFTGKELKSLSEDEATKDAWAVVVKTPSQARFPNGEGMLDMQHRVVDALEAIIAAHPDLDAPVEEGKKTEKPRSKIPQIVAVVAHADVIKAALAHYLGMPFDNFQRLGVQPASVSAVMIATDEKTGERQVMVNSVNQVAR